jgi:TrmH family RNA methyltransferase
MGGEGIILIGDCTDPFDPSSVRASMGSIFSQKIIKTDQSEFSRYIRSHKMQLIGTSDKGSVNFRTHKYEKASILLMGSEREGLPAELLDLCQATVSIPMLGKGDSLNVSVAASIVLYEIQNQLSTKQ